MPRISRSDPVTHLRTSGPPADLRSLENMAGTRVGVELADLAGIE